MQKAHLKRKRKRKRKKKNSERAEQPSISLERVRKRIHLNVPVAPLAVHDNHSFLEEVEMRFGQKDGPLKKKKLL